MPTDGRRRPFDRFFVNSDDVENDDVENDDVENDDVLKVKKVRKNIFLITCCGRGQVVSELALYSDNQRSNPTEVCKFYWVNIASKEQK